jgi:16S rRNA (uracil1498-N3)-methyltransferase
MRIPRIYTAQSLVTGTQIDLDEGAARYLTSVLRMAVGQTITLFNGHGGEYSAQLTQAKKGKASAEITGFLDADRESLLELHLAIGISRGERMDWIVQKATELGINQITPLFTERCEVKLSGERLEKRIAHWQQVAISACEQAQRNSVPTINRPMAINQWIPDSESSLKLVLHHRSEKRLSEMANTDNSIGLLIGPEGGLSDNEIVLAQSHQFQPLALGPRVLRTETAPLAAISIIQSVWGDMG